VKDGCSQGLVREVWYEYKAGLTFSGWPSWRIMLDADRLQPCTRGDVRFEGAWDGLDGM